MFAKDYGRVCLAITLLTPSSIFAQNREHRERVRIVDQGVVIPRSEFNIDRIRNDALRFLRDNDAKSTFLLRWMAAVDHSSLEKNYVHGTPLHNSYESTVGVIHRDGGLPKGPLARVLALGGAAKLSYLDQGALKEEILSGGSDDPTKIREGTHRYELLHFVFHKLGAASLPPHEYSLDLFLKAEPELSVGSSVRVFERFRKLTSIEDLFIHIRTDSWFMEADQYPLVLAFTSPLTIPNSLQYRVSPSLGCALVSGKVQCTGSNFQE